MRMDPRFLRTFVTVARVESFSDAARELGYTQSAVSQHVAALESDLGTALLQRRPVAPTEAGERLLEHAHAILLRLDSARADVVRLAAGPPGRLTLGATPLAASLSVPAAVAAACAALPRLDVTVRVADRDTVAIGVATGALDAGLVDGIAAPGDGLRLPDTGLPVAAFAEAPLAVALPDGHPLAGRAGLRLEDLVDARWIEAPGVTAPLAEIAMLARAEGFRAALRYEGSDVGGLLALVAAGHGLALLPARVLAGAGVALVEPRLVHRTELLRGSEAGAALRL
jgi:DNA-binding transcriptional LysR family regulator